MRSGYLRIAVLSLACTFPLEAAGPRADFDSQVSNSIERLNREAADSGGAMRIAGLIQAEYATPVEDLQWAVDHQLPWGEIVAFAYIQATNGRSFPELGSANAQTDFWTYTEKAGMNSDKMAHSLKQFLKRAERERNSRIFEQMRTTRRASRMPDLGSGFGLFQDALDFRRIEDSPRPTKVYTVGGGLSKGEQ